MTEPRIPAENVSPIAGADLDVIVLEERLERLLAAPIDPDAAWALIRERIRSEPSVVPVPTRRRRFRPLVLAIAAALLVSGVAFAAVGQRDGRADRPTGPDGIAPHVIAGTTAPTEAGDRGSTSTPVLGPSGSGSSPAPTTAPSPSSGTGSPSSGGSTGSVQQPGQDQQGGQDQQSPSPGQDQQQDRSDTGDGSGTQSDTAATGGDQGSIDPSSVDGDQ